MFDKKKYHISATTDAHYIVLLAALLKSLEQNLADDSCICFHIIEIDIPIVLKKQLVQGIDSNKVEIHWIRPTVETMNQFAFPIDWSSYPQNIYMRLLIPYLLDQSIDKVLYLDVDMMVFKSISHLFETPMHSNIIAAVKDQQVLNFGNSWGGVRNYQSLGLRADLPYFNTGLILIDMKKWRSFDVTNKVIVCINQNKRYANYPDQYGLNVVLADNWTQLNPKWNYFSTGNELNPFLVHFVGRKPIFRSYNGNSLYKNFFFGYLKGTFWEEFEVIGEFKRLKKKFRNVFDKLIRIASKLN